MTSSITSIKQFLLKHRIIIPVVAIYASMILFASLYRSFDRYMSLFAGGLIITSAIVVFTRKVKSDLKFAIISVMLINFGILYQAILHSENNAGRLQVVYIAAFILAALIALAIRIVVRDGSNKTLIKIIILMIPLLYLMLLVIGSRENGVLAWIRIGPLSIQVTEITKILSIVAYALILSEKRSEKDKFRKGIGIYLLNAVFLAVYSELGTLIVLTCAFTIMMFIFLKVRYGLFFLCYLAALGIIAWFLLGYYGHSDNPGSFGKMCNKIYEKIYLRFDLWLNPEHYSIYNEANQSYVAMEAIRVGGWFGENMYPLYLLPAVNTDYAFVGLVSKMGVVPGLLYAVLYSIFMMQGIKTFRRSTYSGIYISLVLCMFVSSFLTILGSTGVIPIMGIGVSLLSYGGTSLCSGFFIILFVLLARAREKDWNDRLDEMSDRIYDYLYEQRRLKRVAVDEEDEDDENDLTDPVNVTQPLDTSDPMADIGTATDPKAGTSAFSPGGYGSGLPDTNDPESKTLVLDDQESEMYVPDDPESKTMELEYQSINGDLSAGKDAE